MKIFKGTPGKWRKDDGLNENVDDTYHSIKAGSGFYDCSKSMGFELTGFCSESDANLISEAPALLEMLSDLVRCYKRDGYLTNADLEEAEDVITKALGE